MNEVETAEARFYEGYNCAQSVLMAFAPRVGIAEAQAAGLAGGFGGGVGGMRGTCGAFSAVVMVYGAVRGYDKDDLKDKTAFYAEIRRLKEDFVASCGALECATLLRNASAEISANPSARTETYYGKRPCARFVRAAASLLQRALS